MKTGAQIALEAMEKEYARLKRLEAAAKKECDENMNAACEIINVQKEFIELMKSGECYKEELRKLELLEKRDKRARRALAKDILKLTDKHINYQFAAEDLMREIIYFKLGNKLAD